MPITTYGNSIPVAFRNSVSQTIPSGWMGRFNFLEPQSAINLTLSSLTAFSRDAEIIIRNAATSLAPITIVDSGTIIDVSGDLGLVIPAGGIGELKRIGASNIWSFYGYIES